MAGDSTLGISPNGAENAATTRGGAPGSSTITSSTWPWISAWPGRGRCTGGEKARVTVDISPNSPDGRIQFEGTEWKANADRYIPEGEVVEIVEKKNITFKVKRVSGTGGE